MPKLDPSHLARAGLACLALTLATPGHAQTAWTADTTEMGHRIYGTATAPGGSLQFICTAPSPQGRPMVEQYENEIHGTGPFEMYIGFLDALFEWSDPYTIQGASIILDGTAYALPPIDLDEFSGTIVRFAMADPMVLALYDAGSLVLNTGQGTAYEYPVDGLGQSVDTAMRYCVDRWAAVGETIPSPLNRFWPVVSEDMGADATPIAPDPSTVGVASDPDLVPLRYPQPTDVETVTFVPPSRPAGPGQTMDIRAIQTGNDVCNGAASFGEGAIWPGDIDGDGQSDAVMNWGFVECISAAGIVTPVPGACDTSGQCRVTVFSSANTGAGFADFNILAFHAEPDPDGPAPLFFSTREAVCGAADVGAGCTAWLSWTGSGFTVVNPWALPIGGATDPAAPTFQADANTLPDGYSPAPAGVIPNSVPPAIEAHLEAMCQGEWGIVDDTQIQATDIDGDGTTDFMLNWSGLVCADGAFGGGFCGAANCRIDVFVSSRGYTAPEELLGISADFVADAQGRVGVLLSGTPFVCADGFCDTPFYWDGSGLSQ